MQTVGGKGVQLSKFLNLLLDGCEWLVSHTSSFNPWGKNHIGLEAGWNFRPVWTFVEKLKLSGLNKQQSFSSYTCHYTELAWFLTIRNKQFLRHTRQWHFFRANGTYQNSTDTSFWKYLILQNSMFTRYVSLVIRYLTVQIQCWQLLWMCKFLTVCKKWGVRNRILEFFNFIHRVFIRLLKHTFQEPDLFLSSGIGQR